MVLLTHVENLSYGSGGILVAWKIRRLLDMEVDGSKSEQKENVVFSRMTCYRIALVDSAD